MPLPNIADALRRGLRTVQDYAGEPISYYRGTARASLTAVRGDKSTLETATGEDGTVQGTRVDWIIRGTVLAIASGTIVPIESDIIEDRAGVRYRVTKHPVDGKPARWLEHRLAMRIHTLVVIGER